MKTLTSNLIQALQLEATLTKSPVSDSVINQLQTWGQGSFQLVVAGEIKKGKSSFINALLGTRDLVPVSSDVATSTIFKIRHGEEISYKVHFLEWRQKDPLMIQADELHHYGTEDGNPCNNKDVDFIEVTCPSSLLRSGIVIIDTPGLGGQFKNHKKITWQYIPSADAVFFITDSVESPIGSLELEYLESIKDITPHLYFAQTKTSAVDGEARDARKKNNLSALAQLLGVSEESIDYFLLDAKLRFDAQEYDDADDLLESGYPQLVDYINKVLKSNQQSILARKAIQLCQPTLARLPELLSTQKKILSSDSVAQQEKIALDIKDKQKELDAFQRKQQLELLRTLNQGVDDIRLSVIELLEPCKPSGEIQKRLEGQINNISDIEALRNSIKPILDQIPESFSQVLKQVDSRIGKNLDELLQRFDLDIVSSFTGAHTIEGDQNFSSARNGFDSSILGYSIAAAKLMESISPFLIGLCTKGLRVSISKIWVSASAAKWLASPQAAIISTAAGVIIQKGQEYMELRSAKKKCCEAVSQDIASLFYRVTREVDQVITEIRKELKDRLKQYSRSQMAELEQQLNDIHERGELSQQELQMKNKLIEKQEAQYHAIQEEVNGWSNFL